MIIMFRAMRRGRILNENSLTVNRHLPETSKSPVSNPDLTSGKNKCTMMMLAASAK